MLNCGIQESAQTASSAAYPVASEAEPAEGAAD